MKNEKMGPWRRAFRAQQAPPEGTHAHDPMDENVPLLIHAHEYDLLDHTHEGFGPGYLPS